MLSWEDERKSNFHILTKNLIMYVDVGEVQKVRKEKFRTHYVINHLLPLTHEITRYQFNKTRNDVKFLECNKLYSRRGQQTASGPHPARKGNFFLALTYPFWLKCGPRDTKKGAMWHVDQNSCPPLL